MTYVFQWTALCYFCHLTSGCTNEWTDGHTDRHVAVCLSVFVHRWKKEWLNKQTNYVQCTRKDALLSGLNRPAKQEKHFLEKLTVAILVKKFPSVCNRVHRLQHGAHQHTHTHTHTHIPAAKLLTAPKLHANNFPKLFSSSPFT